MRGYAARRLLFVCSRNKYDSYLPPGFTVSPLLPGFCNPEPAEASRLGGRQQRPSVFSLVPCHKTPLPEHPRVPMCTTLRPGTSSLEHLYRLLLRGERPASCRSSDNDGAIWKQDRYTTALLTLIGGAGGTQKNSLRSQIPRMFPRDT